MKIKIELQEFDLNSEEIHMIKRIYRFYVHPDSTLLTISDKETIQGLVNKKLIIPLTSYYQLTSMGNKVYNRLMGKR